MFIDRSPVLAGLNYAKGQVLTRLKLRRHHSGSTARSKSLDNAIAYIRQVVADYITYGAGGDFERLRGKDIVEVGPGDNLGVALLLLAKGARTVTCIDGFIPASDSRHNARVYAALYNGFSAEERERVRDVVTIHSDGTATLAGSRLLSRYGTPIDAAASPLTARAYDVVLSRAVLEHVGDLHTGWRNMAACLRPGGEMWHKVDFRCHNLFGAIHPLYFLTVPDGLWNLISRPDPTLNRLRLPTYRDLAARDFQESRFYITHILADDEIFPHVETLAPGIHYAESQLAAVRAIRPRLLSCYADYSDQDLLVTGIFLRAGGVRP